MTRREVVRCVFQGQKPPYVPWSFSFTQEAWQKLLDHYQVEDLDEHLQNHILWLGEHPPFFEDIGNDRVKDYFGVIWDRSADKDIGVVENCLLPEPTLEHYSFPNPVDARFFNSIPSRIDQYSDRFRIFGIGFSLFERAWTLRGMENLLMDFVEEPQFVEELFRTIADYNIAQVKKALTYDIDAVYFGDDWGQQHGLIMGPQLWHQFIFPELKRMYQVVREAGKHVMIHSCGDVDELFDDLVSIGLNCFNPFQPEVMDVPSLMRQYRGRLAFFGGLSTQKTLPYGSVEDVKKEAQFLIELGSEGGFILSPAHSVEGDVPLENMIAFIEVAHRQTKS